MGLLVIYATNCTCCVVFVAPDEVASQSPDGVVRVFLKDDVLALNSTRPSPANLGSFPYECVGNIERCPNGFTLAMWYRVQQPQYGVWARIFRPPIL